MSLPVSDGKEENEPTYNRSLMISDSGFLLFLHSGKHFCWCSKLPISAAQMKSAEGITEELKAKAQMESVRRMENIHARAKETALADLIYI